VDFPSISHKHPRKFPHAEIAKIAEWRKKLLNSPLRPWRSPREIFLKFFTQRHRVHGGNSKGNFYIWCTTTPTTLRDFGSCCHCVSIIKRRLFPFEPFH
jgi:hypothetical protein